MAIFSWEDLNTLSGTHEGWCISIFMPTIEKSQQTRQNPIRFKNLLDEAEDMLRKAGLREPDIASITEELRVLLDDGPFWQEQEQGLAVFLGPDIFRTFSLPEPVEEQVVVNHRYYLKPLLPMLERGKEEFYILALSQNELRLLRATERMVEVVEVPDLPENIEDALPESDDEQPINAHPRVSNPGARGDGASVRFGYGQGDEDRDTDLVRYFHIVDRAVSGYLKDSKAPLVLAGVEYLQPLYEETNTYQSYSGLLIPGNYDGARPEELRDAAWELLKPHIQGGKDNDVNRYRMLAGNNDRRAVKDLTEIIKAAPFGRVETLFVDKNAKQWGVFDETTMKTKFQNAPSTENQDLLDYVAVHTLMNGGTVYAVDSEEMPDSGRPAQAIFRY
jgi:hypothetical protein